MIKPDSKKLNLPNVTLCAVSSINIVQTLSALKKSMQGITYARVIFITNEKIPNLEGIEVIGVEKLDYNQYSHFMLFKLKDYIQTDFVLLVQHDGYVLRPQKWDNVFLNYDYIGAPWPPRTQFLKDGTEVRVGNGGFSFRSKKMLESFSELGLAFTDQGTGFFHEDGNICVYHRKTLEQAGIKFAPVSVASRFSRERWCGDSEKYPFGFHNGRKNILGFVLKKLRKYL
jgi:hypothetical protein